jgi:hypothetical protein
MAVMCGLSRLFWATVTRLLLVFRVAAVAVVIRAQDQSLMVYGRQ